MKPRVKLTNATLISIHSELDDKVPQVLYAIIAEDCECYKKGEILFTSKVMNVSGLEYRTFGAYFCLLEAEPSELDVSVREFNLMHDQMYSPDELIKLRQGNR
ncbi:hypothetical protein [Pseudoalteromonas phenolica]|uniref:hypothetical protein n=1 Tax=Pseudoalteromonas phenolica TaxID=161398 RepID=UPI00110B627C|nr:hypothetical protein [Pseudoalteromonas phenolica]TMO54597.1 hypothetical protein CWC21_14540 [Pseudoalteromonas phenolica]